MQWYKRTMKNPQATTFWWFEEQKKSAFIYSQWIFLVLSLQRRGRNICRPYLIALVAAAAAAVVSSIFHRIDKSSAIGIKSDSTNPVQ